MMANNTHHGKLEVKRACACLRSKDHRVSTYMDEGLLTGKLECRWWKSNWNDQYVKHFDNVSQNYRCTSPAIPPLGRNPSIPPLLTEHLLHAQCMSLGAMCGEAEPGRDWQG